MTFFFFFNTENTTYLYSGFGEFYVFGDLFSGVYIRIMRFLKSSFQFLQLRRRKSGPYSPLFPFLRKNTVVARVRKTFIRG